MKPSNFGKWAVSHPLGSFVFLPAVLSLALMAMYFSGNVHLQNIVAPTIDNVPLFTAREFGLLEMLQNLFLLCIVFYSIRCFIAARDIWVRTVALILVLISMFAFLEEIDYGTHFIEYTTGEYESLAQETWNRNWHNKISSSGVQNVSYINLAAKIGMLSGFVLAPLLLSRIQNRTVRLLVPSKWVVATVVLIVLLSLLAHFMDEAGHSYIGGTVGNLDYNISEFRELNMYYLFLLYVVTLDTRIIAMR